MGEGLGWGDAPAAQASGGDRPLTLPSQGGIACWGAYVRTPREPRQQNWGLAGCRETV